MKHIKKKLKDYVNTLKAECKYAQSNEEKTFCNKVITRLDDILKNGKKSTLKNYAETLDVKIKLSNDACEFKFYSEIKNKIKKILKG